MQQLAHTTPTVFTDSFRKVLHDVGIVSALSEGVSETKPALASEGCFQWEQRCSDASTLFDGVDMAIVFAHMSQLLA